MTTPPSRQHPSPPPAKPSCEPRGSPPPPSPSPAPAVASDDTTVRAVAAATSLGLFAVGVAVFFWAYAIAVSRSRTDEIGIGGLFFLAGEGTAPKRPTTHLRAALAAQIAIALAAAAARPFTSLAFGVLAPLSAVALTGLYGARHGRFGPRSR